MKDKMQRRLKQIDIFHVYVLCRNGIFPIFIFLENTGEFLLLFALPQSGGMEIVWNTD